MSWPTAHTAVAGVVAAVEVVADGFGRGGVLATITVRLAACTARARVSVDGRHVSTVALTRSADRGAGPGHLFHHVTTLPADLLHGRTHLLTVVVDGGGEEETEVETQRPGHQACAEYERLSLVTHETAFYARRLSAPESRTPTRRPAQLARAVRG